MKMKVPIYKAKNYVGDLVKSNGKIDTWPDNMTGSVLDKLIADLI